MNRPNYVIQTNEAVLIPTNQSRGITFLKTGVWIVVAVIVLGSLLFQDNLFSELSWTARVLLFVLALGVTFLGGKKNMFLHLWNCSFLKTIWYCICPKDTIVNMLREWKSTK